MKYFILITTLFLLFGCARTPNNYDFNLSKENVICNPVKVEEVIVRGRVSTTYMQTTFKCFFTYNEKEDIRTYNEREELKKLINKE